MASSRKTQNNLSNEASFTVAKSEDGTIQITFVLIKEEVKKAQEKVLKEIGKSVTIPGFRKGKAPLEKIKSHTPSQKLIEKILAILLPKKLTEAISKNKIKPAIYPRFELIKAKDDEDWEVRATTAEIPEFSIDGYKARLIGEIRSKKIVKSQKDTKEEMPREQKQDILLRMLLDIVEVNVPTLLIKEEADSKLAQLLQRIEKLGLTLESYLTSIGKNPKDLRQEYENHARSSIALDLILTKIAQEEQINISQDEIENALKATQADPQIQRQLNSPEQVNILKAVLLKRKALDYLTSLWDNA